MSAAEEPTSFATPPGGRRFRARDALVCIGLAALLLVLFEGRSIRRTGEEMDPGLMRSLVLVVGRPAGWLADRLPLADAAHDATAWLSPDDDLGAAPGFEAQTAAGPGRGVPPVAPDAFDPRALGGSPAPRRTLRTLLVTGDSMAMPLDVVLARRLAGHGGVKVIRDPHVGTGISKSVLVDWGKLSAHQASRDEPDAAVVFLGANEGFPMPGPGGRPVACCAAGWAAVYATRARRMMDAYRRGGAARVYWLLLPLPRDPRRVRIAHAVNAAVTVAADAYRAQVRVLDMARVFTPGDRYRDAMPVGGRETIVRQADGIHLNERGAELAADAVLRAFRPDFRLR